MPHRKNPLAGGCFRHVAVGDISFLVAEKTHSIYPLIPTITLLYKTILNSMFVCQQSNHYSCLPRQESNHPCARSLKLGAQTSNWAEPVGWFQEEESEQKHTWTNDDTRFRCSVDTQ